MILAPPPDLVVTSLNVSNNESVRTGDILVISYNVTNEGAGPSFESYWEDYVVSQYNMHCILLYKHTYS